MTDINEWSGPVGDVWAQEWQRTDRSFGELTAQLVPAIVDVAPESGPAVDLGCGAGEIAIGLAAVRHELNVVGIDISEGLLEIARHRAEGLHNIEFEHGDAAERVSARAPVDLYVSRHGVMFFDDPVAAFSAFHRAASPQASLIFSCFRDWRLNGFASKIIELTGEQPPLPDVPGPFAFASQDKVAAILSQSGWGAAKAEPVDFSYVVGQGEDPVADAVSFMRRIGPAARAIRVVDEDKRPAIIEGLHRICEEHRDGDAVLLPAAAWIWSARA